MEGMGADGGWYFIDHRHGAIYTDSVANFSFGGKFVKASAASKDEKKLTALECRNDGVGILFFCPIFHYSLFSYSACSAVSAVKIFYSREFEKTRGEFP